MFTVILSALALLGSQSAYAACPAGTVSRGEVSGKEVCAFAIKKYLNSDITLTADNDYLLEQGVYFGGDNKDSSVLRIQAGTKIMANSGAFLAIMRGSKIYAEGTAQSPVVFTTSKTSGRKRGEWGGLVLNGNAPINACAGAQPVCEAISEGIKEEQVKFGGNNPEDSSGVLRYVRVEFGGYPIAPDNELNGITFNAVGAGTEVDYVQVHRNADDGVEFFGGTVNVKHLVLSDNDDDSVDWDMGWSGKGQFILIKHAADVADNGFEADNLVSPMNALPRSNPELSNVTMLGNAKSGYGMLLRRGTGMSLSNAIITGFSKGCIDVDDNETFANGASVNAGIVSATGLKMNHSILGCTKAFEEENGDIWSIASWFKGQEGNQIMDPLLNGYIPAVGSPALRAGVAPEDFFFEPVDYIGAVGSAAEDWTQGWTSYSAE